MNKQKQYKNSLNEQISGLVMPIFVSMRPKQWSKNLLIFFALLFSVQESWNITNWSTVDSMLANSIIAFIIFSAISGSIYLINDVIDYRKDSIHPIKSTRPIASGKLSRRIGIIAGTSILLPGLIALPILTYSGLDQLTWEDLPSNVTALGSMGLIIWVLTEIHRANRVREKLDDAVKELNSILTIIQKKLPFAKSRLGLDNLSKTLPALAALVKIREGILSTTSWAESQPSETNLFPFIGALGKEISTIIHEMVKIPQDAAKILISTLSEDLTKSINTKLKGWCKPYIDPSNRETAQLILRSAAPTIWLGFLVWFTGIAP